MKASVARGTVTASPSKSYTHRAMVLGALTHSHFQLKNALLSDDTKATLDALYALGTEVRTNHGGIRLLCEELRAAPGVIDARNSGTTMRLITGIASLLPSTTTLTGDESLVKRPMGPLVDALKQLGAKCAYLGAAGRPPLRVTGPIAGSSADISGDISSQFISSLLIACAEKRGDTKISVRDGITSRPYVDMTLEMLHEFGAQVDETEGGFRVAGGQTLSRDSYTVPGDFSSAAYPLAAAAITGGDVTVRNLRRDSPQGDKALLDHLRTFGASVHVQADAVRVVGKTLKGAEVNVRDTPDLFPILAVIGSVADGKTVIRGGENLAFKESDRIATTTSFLQSMGARIVPREGGCEIVGVERLHGASIGTEGDHRILMAASVAALASSTETRIEDDKSFSVSYPGFIRDMHQLGCRLEVRR